MLVDQSYQRDDSMLALYVTEVRNVRIRSFTKSVLAVVVGRNAGVCPGQRPINSAIYWNLLIKGKGSPYAITEVGFRS